MRFRFNEFVTQFRSGTLTANRTITLPDISGSLAVASQLKRESLLITTSRNLVATDNLRQLYSTSGSNLTLTIQAATFTLDDEVEVASDSTGTVTIAAGAGVTINGASTSVVVAAGRGGYLKFRSATAIRWYGGV